MKSVKRILVATDFSPGAQAAVDLAVTMARAIGGRITLLHVDDLPAWAYVGAEAMINEDLLRSLAALSAKKLAEARADLLDKGITVEIAQAEGPPYLAIVRAAELGKFDLIVVGTHGRTGLPHFLLGSTAEKVVRSSPIPVLTVRAQ
jgi:nucleotide-binding universal stress UspA family protein